MDVGCGECACSEHAARLGAAIQQHHERIKTLGLNDSRGEPQWGGPWDHELWATIGLPSGPDEEAEWAANA